MRKKHPGPSVKPLKSMKKLPTPRELLPEVRVKITSKKEVRVKMEHHGL